MPLERSEREIGLSGLSGLVRRFLSLSSSCNPFGWARIALFDPLLHILSPSERFLLSCVLAEGRVQST